MEIYCTDPPPEDMFFLPNSESIIHNFSIDDFDLVISVDCGADYMTALTDIYPQLFGGKFPLINVDHHPSNDNFGKWNLVDTSSASTTQILTELFQFLDIEISYKMATALLTGIYTDTGSFQHSNTTPRELKNAAFLQKKGASIHKITKNIFHTNKISTLKLWGRVLDRAYKDEEGITISHVSDLDFIETGADISDLSGVINYLNSVPDAKFSMLLTEKDGKVKGSFRTMRDDVDLAKIASSFGGGGHVKAAGFTMPGKLKKEVRWKIVQE